MNDHKLRVYDDTGALQAEITNFTSLSVTRVADAPGMMMVGVSGVHSILDSIGNQWQLEYWRKPKGEGWAREFVGLYKDVEWAYFDLPTALLLCPGLLSMLQSRIIAWPEFVTDRSIFSATVAETVMKTLVDYNAGPNATVANGRLREGAITGLSVAKSTGAGNSLSLECAGNNLLSTLQAMAPAAGGDFDLVKTSSTTWEFRWYTGQLGTDRTATVVFALPRGNMADPIYKEMRSKEKTVAVAYGRGHGYAQETSVQTGAGYSLAVNDTEIMVQAYNTDTTARLDMAAIEAVNRLEFKPQFSFKTVETPATRYGVHFFLGDLVTAINPFTGAEAYYKVKQVTISLNKAGEENVDVVFEWVQDAP